MLSATFRANIHVKLSLSLFQGGADAVGLGEAMSNSLGRVGLNPKNMISVTTDGASVMARLAKNFDVPQVLCLAHGIHLGVTDVLYASSSGSRAPAFRDIGDIERDSFNIETEIGPPAELKEGHIKDLLGRVRAVVRSVRASHPMTTHLRAAADRLNLDVTNLQLDIQVRWNSIAVMLVHLPEAPPGSS